MNNVRTNLTINEALQDLNRIVHVPNSASMWLINSDEIHNVWETCMNLMGKDAIKDSCEDSVIEFNNGSALWFLPREKDAALTQLNIKIYDENNELRPLEDVMAEMKEADSDLYMTIYAYAELKNIYT